MVQENESIRENFGYYFHPASYSHSPGHPALDVFIRPEPTLAHYDPESLKLRVQQPDPHWQYRISTIELHHRWVGVTDHVVAPGSIVISDRRDKRIEAFSFGGRLRVHREDELTHCQVESSAPILEMLELDSVSGLFATEVQVMMAELRGRSVGHLQIYESRLASVDPWELYRSALVALQSRLTDFEYQEYEPCVTLRDFIVVEIEELKKLGRWGRQPRQFDAMLLPPEALRRASADN